VGQIITFYSYKGGVGRTFALANIAAQLARWGYKTLVVDWDLEAPGLSYFFGHFLSPPLDDHALSDRRGLVEYFEDWREKRTPLDWHAFLEPATLPNILTPVHLLLAGNQTSDYGQRARALDWEKLYADGVGEHLVELREGWRKDYDFVFIDSRTGLADTAGICTVQMPDVLVLVFTASYASLSGITKVAKTVLQARSEAVDSRSLPYCLPIISRLAEIEEVDLAKKWIGIVSKEIADLVGSWRPRDIPVRRLVEMLKLPHINRWSYGEELPVLTEDGTSTAQMTYHIHTLAAVLAHRLSGAWSLVEDRSAYVKRAGQQLVPRAEGQEGAPDQVLPILAELERKAGEASSGGDLSAAEALFSEMLAKAESAFGPDHSALLTPLRGIARIHERRFDFSRAEILLRRALDVDEKSLGPEDPNLATDLNNLAHLLQATNRLAEAQPLYHRALEIAKKLGNQSSIATTFHQLGRLAQEQDDPAEARRFYSESLEIQKKLGDPLPDLANRRADHHSREVSVAIASTVLRATKTTDLRTRPRSISNEYGH
jgi:MinD-like ATPase involved in chromosome partitioning or flagellar assembly/tetratricopeptide (TPR) repeat protein